MQTRSTVVSLVVLAVCLVIAAPGFAQDQQPAPKSYTAIDPGGSVQECFDFNKKGVVYGYFNDRKGNFQTLDVSGITGTPADSVYWGQIQNIFFEGPLSRMQFHGTCEQQGGAWWGWVPSWGNASCSLATYMRFVGGGNFNSTYSMIQIGPLYRNCAGLFGPDAKVEKGTRRRR